MQKNIREVENDTREGLTKEETPNTFKAMTDKTAKAATKATVKDDNRKAQ